MYSVCSVGHKQPAFKLLPCISQHDFPRMYVCKHISKFPLYLYIFKMSTSFLTMSMNVGLYRDV